MPAPDAAAAAHDPDVLVIGGGVAGLFCAYYLRRAGARVTVVERGRLGGPQSCSYGNTGFAGTQGAAPLAEPGVLRQGLRWLADPHSPLYIRPRLDPALARWLWQFRRVCTEQDFKAGFAVLAEMKRRSLDLLREVCGEGPLAGTLREPGMVLAFKTAQGFAKACRAVPHAVAHGVPLRVLGPGELAELEPDAEFDICGALYNAEGAYLHPGDFMAGLTERASAAGVRLLSDAQAVGFEVSGTTITGVATTRGDFRPGEVVIAAGAWSAECARKLGIRLAVTPAKGYSITVKTPAGAPRLPVVLGEGKVAIAPFGDLLRFGGTLELSGMAASGISRRRVEGILATVRACLPRMAAAAPEEIWSGLRPCTPDSLPFLGRAAPYDNLALACGHGYIGMGLAPVSGKLVAQVLTGETPDMELAPFRAGRFGRRARPRGGRPPAAPAPAGGQP
jgi:D-amino-acid dehydrogenase